MYLYSFTRFNGPDKVFRLPDDIKAGPGDLFRLGSEFFLCLGKKVSFQELYTKAPEISSSSLERVYPKFLSSQMLTLLHRMVENYYTTYKSVVRLFISDEVEKLLERENKTKDKRQKTKDGEENKSLIFDLGSFICSSKGQTLIVFPDLRTMTNQQSDIETIQQGNSVTLLASHTQNQKDLHRWEIKKGSKSVIMCTYGEIFQDFKDLQKIIRVDPHKWYYANQQDPRYKVGEVLHKLAELWGAEVDIVGV